MRRYDPDKQTVYHAEAQTFEETLFQTPLHSIELIGLADQLFAHDWWVEHKISVPTIEPTRAKDTSSHAETNGILRGKSSVIRLAPSDVNPWFLAHEAAHIAQFYFYNAMHNPRLEGHGREFRAAYLCVTEILLGKQAALDLRANFDQFVKVRRKHAPGKPGSIITVPQVNHALDPQGLGIFPAWRLERQAETFARMRSTSPLVTIPRMNGAIAL